MPGILITALEVLAAVWLLGLALALVRLQLVLRELRREMSDRYRDPGSLSGP